MLPHKTALITGASRGLGLALARALARRGWQLIIDARQGPALEAARVELSRLTNVITITGDVKERAHQRALAAAAQGVGGLDALVNNASLLGPSPQPPLLDYPLDVLEQVYRTNVLAPLAIIQAVRRALKPGARIINVTSDAGVQAYPGWGGYGSSKAALEQLSNVLAVENPHWRVYWVDPGDMRTQMQQEAYPGEDIGDRREDVRDRREDVRDRREGFRDRHPGAADRLENVHDRREGLYFLYLSYSDIFSPPILTVPTKCRPAKKAIACTKEGRGIFEEYMSVADSSNLMFAGSKKDALMMQWFLRALTASSAASFVQPYTL